MRIEVDWRSSRLSALPLMRRTALMAVALAVLAMTGALSAQTTSSQINEATRTSRKPGATLHKPRQSAEYAGANTHSSTRLGTNSTRTSTRTRLTPDEAGRAAGLAILRQRSGSQTPRRRLTHTVRRRSVRRVRLEQASWRSERTRLGRADETADGYPESEGGQAQRDDAPSMESRRMNAAREAMAESETAEENQGENTGSAPVDRMAPSDDAGNKEARLAAEAAQDGDETSAAVPRESGEAAASAGARSRGAMASLVIPRGAMPAPLRGSLESLERQNDRLEAEGLERIEDEADLAARIADKLLVPIPTSSALTVNPDLEENHRYCRPWTAKFLADLAKAHEAVFERPLIVSSAVRTVEYQRKLMRTNGNAAPAEGELVSPHLTGAAVDIAKKGLSRAEMAWMRKQLASLEAAGKIDVEEEFKQECFHITVYKSYAPAEKMGPATAAKPVASRRRTAQPAVEAQGE